MPACLDAVPDLMANTVQQSYLLACGGVVLVCACQLVLQQQLGGVALAGTCMADTFVLLCGDLRQGCCWETIPLVAKDTRPVGAASTSSWHVVPGLWCQGHHSRW